ncbi:Secreted RxLR effector peptide protein [Phytophthora palmivora]|uniref:RxLR effector protein n=1 Tax=Phytophthora palmivora TaxID=4796 RepID=A0A2P4XGW9_9STRA|nr:Secreted RxLR effector peptide protein [Phytophthora palmivora]
MRITFVALVAMVVISGSTIIDAESTSVSTETLTGQAHASNTVVDGVNDKRLLRSHKEPEDDVDDDDSADSADRGDEERISASKLRDLVNGRTSTQFTHWGNQKLSPSRVWDKLNGLDEANRKKVYDWYYKDIYRNGNWRR